ncbi:hypothetical protein D9M69_636190 [compost metagenome]
MEALPHTAFHCHPGYVVIVAHAYATHQQQHITSFKHLLHDLLQLLHIILHMKDFAVFYT